MDRSYYDEIAGQLHGLLGRVADRLTTDDLTVTTELVAANELGVALEQMVGALSEDEQPLAADERADLLALAERMQLGERVARALSLCPAR